MSLDKKKITGKRILLTRPKIYLPSLAKKIKYRGGIPVNFPAIEIKNLKYNSKDFNEIYDYLIFISPISVILTNKEIINFYKNRPLSKIFAIGQTTKNELKKLDFKDIKIGLLSQDSHGLLLRDEFKDVKKKKILIVRGKGGNNRISNVLKKRGAEVFHMENYERKLPIEHKTMLRKFLMDDKLDAWISTSSEVLNNVFKIFGKENAHILKTTPLFVTHPNIANIAYKKDVKKINISKPGEKNLVYSIIEWFN